MLISDFFDKGVRNHPEALALADDHQELTFRQAAALVEQAADRLRTLELGIGTRIAVLSRNGVAPYLVMLAVWRIGGCLVSLSTSATGRDNADMLEQAACPVVLYGEDTAGLMDEIAGRAPSGPAAIAFDRFGTVDTPGMRGAVPAGHARPSAATDHDVAWIVFTGGTTGRSKGVVLTHAALTAMVLGMQAHLHLPSHPRYLVAAPMTHAAGTLIPVVLGLGGSARFIPKVEPQRIIADIGRHAINMLFLPPTAVYMMLASADVRAGDYSTLRHLIYAAAPMAEDKLIEAMDVFGPVMTQMYGQSEYPMMITYMSPADHVAALTRSPSRLASAGRESLVARVEVLDAEGLPLPDGIAGEIAVKGPLRMSGYLDADRGVEPDRGWLRTGDIGRRDADGFIYLLDRAKDMIISGGFNVYSVEVENVLLGCAEVAQCAVIGVPDAKWGEAVKAIVELKPGRTVSAEALIAVCKDQLGSLKAPKSIDFVTTLPRNNLGKVEKRAIRERFWQDRERRV